MTLAADTREAVRRHPFLYDALRAGVVNYSAAARFLDVDGETDAVVAALRRFAGDLPDYDAGDGTGGTGGTGDRSDARAVGSGVRVTMKSGLGAVDTGDVEEKAGAESLLVVGDTALVPDAGSLTAIVGRGAVGVSGLRAVLGRLATAEVAVEAAAGTDGAVVAVVGRRDGPDALRAVEGALGG